MSCSAFLNEAVADEAEDFVKTRGDLRTALRKFVTSQTPLLTEERFLYLVTAVDAAWADVVPKPKVSSILDYLRAQFSLHRQDEALAECLVLLEDAPTKGALIADMKAADVAANLGIVEKALRLVGGHDAEFLAAAQTIFDQLRTSPPPLPAPLPKPP